MAHSGAERATRLDPDSGATLHGSRGLRASFRTWTFATRQDREASELALGHKFHGAVERRYLRWTNCSMSGATSWTSGRVIAPAKSGEVDSL